MSNGDWVSFSHHHGLVEICDGLPTSIKYWKEEFFFVHASAFSGSMAYDATTDRSADPVPELTFDEQLITKMLSDNFVRWMDPDEAILGMAGMSPHWNCLGKKPMEMLEGKYVTLLDRLHRRRILNSALVTEDVIAPDSRLDVSRAEGSRRISPTFRSKGSKLDSNFGKPPTVFMRATSKGFILKKRSESAQDDQLIRMSPPKRKRSGCELKSQSLNDLPDPPVSDVESSKRALKDLVSAVFHECLIESDSEMKYVEDDAKVS